MERLKDIIEKLRDDLHESIQDSIDFDNKGYAIAEYQQERYAIMVEIENWGCPECTVEHYDADGDCLNHHSPMIENAIESEMPDFGTVEDENAEPYDEWNEHGFADCVDYYNYRGY